jgi:hypothetical protein
MSVQWNISSSIGDSARKRKRRIGRRSSDSSSDDCAPQHQPQQVQHVSTSTRFCARRIYRGIPCTKLCTSAESAYCDAPHLMSAEEALQYQAEQTLDLCLNLENCYHQECSKDLETLEPYRSIQATYNEMDHGMG